jgi:hypothetical protein
MADQHNDNIPAVGNQISNDIPDIKENLEFHKDCFQNFCKGFSNSSATALFPHVMKDDDEDTMIQLEESADEDIIRFDIGATGEMITMDETNGLSVDTISEYTADNGVTIDGLSIKDGLIAQANSIDSDAYINGSIDTAHLNTTTQVDTHTGNTSTQTVNLTGATYCFLPRIKSSNGAQTLTLNYGYGSATAPGTSNVTPVQYAIVVGTGYTATLTSRYITGSGPVFWAYGLLNKDMEAVTRWNVAIDHPSYGNGCDPGDLPHPFGDYDKENFQLLVSNPSAEQLEEYKKIAFKDGISLNEFIVSRCEFDFSRSEEWTKEHVTVGTFPDPHDVPIGSEIQRLKKPVPVLKEALVLPIRLKE